MCVYMHFMYKKYRFGVFFFFFHKVLQNKPPWVPAPAVARSGCCSSPLLAYRLYSWLLASSLQSFFVFFFFLSIIYSVLCSSSA